MHQWELVNSKVCTYIVVYSIAKDAKITAKDAKKTPLRRKRLLRKCHCGLCDFFAIFAIPKRCNNSHLENIKVFKERDH
jgi:hypothetical protein